MVPTHLFRFVEPNLLLALLERRARNAKPEGSDKESTRITFNWYVRVTNPVLSVLGYLAGGVYRHSHDSVMTASEAG